MAPDRYGGEKSPPFSEEQMPSQLYEQFIDHCGQLLNAGQHNECQALLDGYLANNADDPIALYLLGSSHNVLGHYGHAIILLELAVSKTPNIEMIWHNLGVAYKGTERTEDAIRCYLKALEIDANRPETLAMMSGAYVNDGNPALAVAWAEKALKLNPTCFHSINHLAHGLLELQRYEEGWPQYKNRWNNPMLAKNKRDFGTIPEWDGKPVKRLVVHGEQGLGDEILFMGYLKTENITELVIECATRLVSLMQRSFPKAEVYGTHAEVMALENKPDAYIAMGELINMFKTHTQPILKPDPERVKFYRERLEKEGPGPYIAVAWEGGVRQTHRSTRNAPLDMWIPLLKHGTPVSIQYTKRGSYDAKNFNIPHWQEAIDNIDEMAALIKACDLVCCVNQTGVHLAGGLGVPCITMTPIAKAWRYYSDTNYMRWYKDVRMITQTEKGNWEDVFQRAEKELADFCEVYRAKSRAA